MKYLGFLISLFLISKVYANDFCFEKAGQVYKINPQILYLIAKIESGFNPNAVNINKNGSFDIGIMQINSYWIPKLKKLGIKPEDLYNPCQNIIIGAWILKQCVVSFGSSWKAIDCYNKGYSKAKMNSKYTKKLKKEMITLLKIK